MNKTERIVTIIDYGLGNLFSIQRALHHIGAHTVLSEIPEEIEGADYLILPGVGAFGEGMKNLREKGLIEPIRRATRDGRPFLGICLGMQLILSESEEYGIHQGLDLIPGRVVRMPDRQPEEQSYKIPNIGWNEIRRPGGSSGWEGTVLDGIPERTSMYFVHSYAVFPDDPATILAETEYGSLTYCSAIRKNNICGTQFHPEKSGEFGLEILRNFIGIKEST
jgi:glutamine amidotransferase